MQHLPEIKQDTSLITEDSSPSRSRKTSTSSWQMLRKDSKSRLNVDFTNQDPGSTPQTRSSVVSIQEPPTSGRPSIRGRLNMGQVGRRLSMMRRMSKSSIKPEPEEEAKIELPTSPRFISSLSVEAQYAAFKSYEDLLFEKLLEARPEYSGCWQRTPSPPNNLKMLRIKDKTENENESESKDENTDAGYGSDSESSEVTPPPVFVPLTALRQHRSVTDIKPLLPELSREKRIMMTYRFQCAFDILDSLKLNQGLLVTSPRIRPLTAGGFDPIRNFAAWHDNWSKEFKIIGRRVPQSAR